MKLSLNNFLMGIKQIVTGGGYEKDLVTPRNDAGFLVDRQLIGESVLLSGTTYVADSNGFPVLSTAATNTTGPVIPFSVPRDYDEATDEIHFRFVARMGGSSDTTTTVTVTPKKQVVGSAAAAFSPSTQVTVALTATNQIFDMVWRSQGLARDTMVEFTITTAAHGTDAVIYELISVSYRSTLVSYHESDGSRDGKNGTFLR